MRRALSSLVAGLLLAAVPALAAAQSELGFFGPKQYDHPAPGTVRFAETVAVPADVTGPFTLHVTNGDGRDGVRDTSVYLNGARILGEDDFEDAVELQRTVQLQAQNQLVVVIGGRPRTHLTLGLSGRLVPPVPTALAPDPLTVFAGASANVVAALAPTPRFAGALAVSTGDAGVATAPTSVAFAAGQAAVTVPVSGIARGTTSLTVALNGATLSSQVNVVAPLVTALAPDPLTVFAGKTASVVATLSPAPALAGTLYVSTGDTGVATAPASVAFAAGQTQVAIEVTAVARGGTSLTASLNGSSVTSQLSVVAPLVTALAPDPLKVFAGAKANVTATIAPAPAAAGSLSVSLDKPALATVPASVAFAAGQTLVTIEVTGVAAGDAILGVSLNGVSTSSKVSVLPPPPSIDSISPASAAPGSLVTLNGQNLDPVPANNRVSFAAAGGTAIAAAIASSGTQLTVRVPAGAVTGAVTLDNPRGTAQGPAFTVLTLDTRFTATRAGLNAPLANQGTPVTPLVVGAIPGDTFDFRLLTDPTKGHATVVGGRLAYTANAELNGVDSFTYRAAAADGSTRDGTALVKLYTGANLTRCTAVSTVAQRINVRDCAFYGEVQTRISATGAPVTVQYIAARPSSGAAPKAVVFLIGGGDFDLNFIGNAATGQAGTIGANFVVRTAQIFADAGYLAIAMNKPSDLPTPGAISTTVDADLYRVSVRHAVDILGVLREVNTDGLDVFLSGTSRGAISAVAANLIAEGISLSSAVTRPSGSALFVNDPRHANLLPMFVQRPSHVLWNTLDQCQFSQPADSRALADALIAANGLAATFGFVTGGLIGDPTDPCGAQHFHGYYAIEPDAVGLVTAWLDSRVAALAGNRRPDATFAVLPTAPGVPLQIDLGALTGDADGDALSYGLAYVGSGRGGTVTQSGAVLAYTPPAGATGGTDNFVYFVSDGRGGVNAAVITIRIGG